MEPLKKLAQDIGSDFTDENNLWRKGKSFFLLPKKLQSFMQQHEEEPTSAGLFLGEMNVKKFIPSANFFRLIEKEITNKIYLDTKAAWLFICGRDIFAQSITEEEEHNHSGLFAVYNEKNELLGLAKKKNGKYYNEFDLGFLLRREQKRK